MQVAAAELNTWSDLNDDGKVGGSVQSIEYVESFSQWDSVAVYKTEAGLVCGRGGSTLNVGDDVGVFAFTNDDYEGLSGKLLVVSGSPFQLDNGCLLYTSPSPRD